MLTEKKIYLDHCMQSDPQFLRECLMHPSQYMRPIHLLLIRLALRKRGLA